MRVFLIGNLIVAAVFLTMFFSRRPRSWVLLLSCGLWLAAAFWEWLVYNNLIAVSNVYAWGLYPSLVLLTILGGYLDRRLYPGRR